MSQLTAAHMQSLPHTYKSIYHLAWHKLWNLADAPTQRYHQPSFWTKWLSRRVATILAPVKAMDAGLSPTIWRRLHTLPIPHAHTQFIYEALWHKLRTDHRLRHWLPHQQLCPIDGTDHTREHSLVTCAGL